MLRIELLGKPSITVDGEPRAPRGTKAWALLAYLLLSDAPPPRDRIATLLFPDANDAGGALRWNLSQLRAALGTEVEVGGEPLTLRLPADVQLDLEVVRSGSWVEALALERLGEELLAGVEVDASPAFAIWLENERRHVHAMSTAILADAVRARSARGQDEDALRLARRLVELDPYEERFHTLLVRCVANAEGDTAARAQLDASAALLRGELGVEPSRDLVGALDHGLGLPRERTGIAAVRAQLEAGEAAVAAGLPEAGIEALRRAVVAARATGDPVMLARALLATGSALVHAARGSDENGSAALHEAVALGEDQDQPGIAATASRELGYIELLNARYERAEWWLGRARALAGDDDRELAWIEAVGAYVRHDTGDHDAAGARAARAIAHADRAEDQRPKAFALAGLGRGAVARGDTDHARAWLLEALETVRSLGWNAYLPWPEAFLAEVDLLEGDVDGAATGFEHAFAMGVQLGDPCWESVAMRGLGLVAAERGDTEQALEYLDDAPRRCRRLPDTYRWVEGYGLAALARVARASASPAAPRWAEAAERFAADHGLRELQAQALQDRAALGVAGAGEVAAAILQDLGDRPALTDA